MKYKRIQIIQAYDATKDNFDSLESSKSCGCYYCLKIFDSNQVKSYIDGSAVCPHCGEQSIIPDSSGIELKEQFLASVHKFWT